MDNQFASRSLDKCPNSFLFWASASFLSTLGKSCPGALIRELHSYCFFRASFRVENFYFSQEPAFSPRISAEASLLSSSEFRRHLKSSKAVCSGHASSQDRLQSSSEILFRKTTDSTYSTTIFLPLCYCDNREQEEERLVEARACLNQLYVQHF